MTSRLQPARIKSTAYFLAVLLTYAELLVMMNNPFQQTIISNPLNASRRLDQFFMHKIICSLDKTIT